MTDRRAFLETMTGAALAAIVPGSPLRARRSRHRLDRIGLQLYTVRDEMKKDLEGTIAKVAGIGYKEVEFAGYFGKSPADVRAILDRNGLAAPSAHVSIDPDKWPQALDAARVIGHRYVVDPKLVQMEMDLYWITKGGQDPLKYFARWPGRFPIVHVKDSMGPPDQKMADVGAGKIDWKRIFGREDQAGIKHFFVEHDQPADPFASIRASCDYLKKLEF